MMINIDSHNVTLENIETCTDRSILKHWATFVQTEIVKFKAIIDATQQKKTPKNTKDKVRGNDLTPPTEIEQKRAYYAFFLSTIQRRISDLKVGVREEQNQREQANIERKKDRLKMNEAFPHSIFVSIPPTKLRNSTVVDFYEVLLHDLFLAVETDEIITRFSESSQNGLIDVYNKLKSTTNTGFTLQSFFKDHFNFDFLYYRHKQVYSCSTGTAEVFFDSPCFIPQNETANAVVDLLTSKNYTFSLKKLKWRSRNQVEIHLSAQIDID